MAADALTGESQRATPCHPPGASTGNSARDHWPEHPPRMDSAGGVSRIDPWQGCDIAWVPWND